MRTASAKRYFPYLAVGTLLLLFVWGASYWIVATERQYRFEQATTDAERAALRWANATELTLQYVDSYLKTARGEFLDRGLEGVSGLVERVPLNPSIISHITVIDENGTPLLVSGVEIKPGTTAKDRGYFKRQKANPADTVYISLPMKGRNSGKLTIRLVRRMTRSDGSFAGVIFGALDVGQLTHDFEALSLGPNSTVTLVGMDKKIRARAEPRANYKNSATDLDFGGSSVWRLLEENPAGHFEETGVVDGVARIQGYRRLSAYPLVAVVGISPADLAEALSGYESFVYTAAALISLLIVVLAVLVFREVLTAQRLREAEAGLQDEVAAQTLALREEIEERKSVGQALQRSEVRLTDFAEASSDWFWEMDEDCRFSYFSERFTKITGVEPESLLGKTREETGIPGVDEAEWAKHLADLAAHRSFRNFQHPRTLPDGRVVHLSVNGTAIFDQEDRFKGYRGTGSDITERKNAETRVQRANQELEQRVQERTEELRCLNDQLREEEGKLREILENSPVGIAIVSHDVDGTRLTGDRLFVNDALVQMFGGTSRENFMEGQIEDSWVDLGQLKAVEETFKNRRELVNFEVQRRRMDGTKWWVSMSTRPIHFNDRDCTMVWHFDITERVQTEESLRQAQKMEAVGQLTGGVAHDFNNLLAIIQGNAELLVHAAGGEDRLTGPILRAAARGADLTQRLLAFSRRQPLRPRSLDLTALIEGMSDLIARTLGETIAIEIRGDPDLWVAMADPGQVENALLNLALNARDAMPRGGKLTIECANAVLDEAYAARNLEAAAGDYVVLAVSDTGTGMSAEVQAHAFEPFFTTKDVGQGSGLGLSMVYGFVKQSGGHVIIYSEEGRGTAVKLYLPRDEAASKSEAPQADGEVPRGGGETILVIEDDEDVRGLAVKMLEGLGYQVTGVPAATAARELLADGKQVDLMLTDVVLPGGTSGPAFAEEARASYPDLKIIFMSGYPAAAAQRGGFLGAETTLLNKPFRTQQLAKAIRQALD